jgi:hypothetical protein
MAKGKGSKLKLHQNAWTTLDQKEWLLSQKPTYLAARVAGKSAVSDFWTSTFKKWLEKWPFKKLTEQEIADRVDEGKHLDTMKVASDCLQKSPCPP